MKRISLLRPSAVLFLLTMLVVPATRAQQTLEENILPYKSITPQVESTIERTAVLALRHISQARSDIHLKAVAEARRDLDETARLIASIRAHLSTATTKNLIHIARNHLKYEPAQRVLLDLPPIYASLEMISVYLPTDKAKANLNRAKGYLERDDKRGAERELALADQSLIIIEVELPLLKIERYVTAAQRDLAVKNTKKADESLQIAERRALALYTSLYSPLFQANRNIWLAFRNYSTTTRAETGKNLEQGRINLGKAATRGSAKGKEETGKLSGELAELEKKLAGEGKVAESALKGAWERSRALSERAAAYLSAGISEEETTLKDENDLIEAKLHVSYAESYQVTTGEPDKAVRELDMASSYLQKAARSTLAGPTDRKKMSEIEKSLQGLKANPKDGGAAVQERYESIKDELGTLIQKL